MWQEAWKAQLERRPQSWQSVQAVHAEYSAPLPPSSQSPSAAKRHVFRHEVDVPGGYGGRGGPWLEARGLLRPEA